MNTRAFDSVKLGDELPPVSIPITVALVTGGAMATRDFFPGHHDLHAARELGSPHIFMNILTTNGLVEAFVENWAGPDCRLASLKIKLGAPNYPGDTMTLTGTVSAVDGARVSIDVRGDNALGTHVSGSVEIEVAR